jgi:hypothetical protein
LDRHPLDRHPLDLRSRRRRHSAADQVAEALSIAERFPVGDPRRSAAQRRAARGVADDVALADELRFVGVRSQLRRWARFAPYLLDDATEAELAKHGRLVVSAQLALLRGLEDDAATSLSSADSALRGLDAETEVDRRAADVAAHSITDRRAPLTAAVLVTLASCHLDDDRHRHIDDWRTRFAIVEGTTSSTLATLLRATGGARGLAEQWWQVRSQVVGNAYSDRRVGMPAASGTLSEHSRRAADALAAAVPPISRAARQGSDRIVDGADNQVVVEADGRMTVTVSHRPTPRGSLMVAHEIGHALHAIESTNPEPPGALVGETIGCWAALVTGLHGVDEAGPEVAAMALALGDTLVEELFVSAAVSAFEDSVYSLVATRGTATVDELNDAWLAAQRQVMAGASVPEHVGSGWARLPALATDPGHAISYVWATVLALAIVARHRGDGQDAIARAIRAGGVEADEFTALLGFGGDEWIAEGLTQLAVELDRLAQLVRSAPVGD